MMPAGAGSNLYAGSQHQGVADLCPSDHPRAEGGQLFSFHGGRPEGRWGTCILSVWIYYSTRIRYKGGEAVGLTRRGKGTKIMAVVDARGLPLDLLLASAQEAEISLAEPTLATSRVPRRRGRPKTRPVSVEGLRRRGIRPCIPYRRGRRPRPGRVPNLAAYRQCWHIERTFAWLGSFRRLLVLFEHSATVYRGSLYLAAALICTRRLTLG